MVITWRGPSPATTSKVGDATCTGAAGAKAAYGGGAAPAAFGAGDPADPAWAPLPALPVAPGVTCGRVTPGSCPAVDPAPGSAGAPACAAANLSWLLPRLS